MKTKRFIIFRNIFFILMALVLVGGLTAGWRAATSDSPSEPAQFQVTGVSISPESQVKVGEEVTVTAYVRNTSETDGTYIPTLRIDDIEWKEKPEIEIPAGETRAVTFQLRTNAPGTYKIEVDGWESTLEVIERPTGAEFRVIGLTIAPPTVEVGETVIVSANIENIGQTDGTYIATLSIDGTEAEKTPEMEIPAGETTTVEFTLAINIAGIYEIEVDGEKGFLEVTPAEG